MPQIGLCDEKTGNHYIVGCPRGDCQITGTAAMPSGPVELMPEHAFLLAQS
jgi:hypothetical protein